MSSKQGSWAICLRPVAIRLLLTYFIGCVLGAVAIAGLAWWSEADWFTDPGPYAPNEWEGYNQGEFVGLALFTFLAPVAFTLLFTAMQHMLRRTSNWDYNIALVWMMLNLTGLVVFGAIWAQRFLKCWGFACIDPDDERWAPENIPYAGLGWQNQLGMSVLLASVILQFAVVYGCIRRKTRKDDAWTHSLGRPLLRFSGHTQGSPDLEGKSYFETSVANEKDEDILYDPYSSSSTTGGGALHKSQSQSGRDKSCLNKECLNTMLPNPTDDTKQCECNQWIMYIVLFPLAIAFAMITLYVPNNWEYFLPLRIAQNAARPFNVPGWPTEYPWASFKTKNWYLTDDWILHSYPSNFFFFSFVISAPLFAMLLRSNRWIRKKVLHRRVPLASPEKNPKCGCLKRQLGCKSYLSGGEIIFWVCLTTTAFLFSWYWWHDHVFNTMWPDPPSYYYPAERLARGFGQVAVFFMSMLMFPVARTSPIQKFFALAWDAGIKYHRWLGYMFLITSLGHMISMYVWYDNVGLFPGDIIAAPMKLPVCKDNFTVPLSTAVFWFSLICFGLACWPYIRRNHFELFYYSHHAAYIILIPTVLWHAQAAWMYLLPGVAIWWFDRAIRIQRSAQPVHIVEINANYMGNAGKLTTLRCHSPVKYRPGQYVFINIQEISLFEWHPFTIASTAASNDDDAQGEFTVHIKEMGGETQWSGELFARAMQLTDDLNPEASLTISVDGPYGEPLEYGKYDNVALVCGGIGVTPCLSIFKDMILSALHPHAHSSQLLPRRVSLTWSSRDMKLFEIIRSTLKLLADLEQSRAISEQPILQVLDNDCANIEKRAGQCQFEVFLNLTGGTRATSTLSQNGNDHDNNNINNNDRKSSSLLTGSNILDDPTDLNFPDNDASSDFQKNTLNNKNNNNLASGQGLFHQYLSHGRPNISTDVFADGVGDDEDTLLFVCGPDSMVEAAETVAYEKGWIFHAETFKL